MEPRWSGVFPAVTTPFTERLTLDEGLFRRQLRLQLEAGVHGIIVLGTLGENPSLTPEEKREVIRIAREVVPPSVPLLTGVAETTTAAACRFAEDAAYLGVDGLMVLPGLLYPADARETLTHFRQVARVTELPIMIYNNPVAYGVDVTPEMFADLAEEPRFVAIKESSDDVRRITDIYHAVGDRYALFIGVDDLALEAFAAGAVGWVAGLVNAFPRTSVRLYTLMQEGRLEKARRLYRWFMPLLHLDASPKLVQNIKLVQMLVGVGTEHVRPPRLPLTGAERAHVEYLVQTALESITEEEI